MLHGDARQMTTESVVARQLTAIRRLQLSRPFRLALEDSLVNTETSVLDYGCGQGDDVRLLSQQNISCTGWDPFFCPTASRSEADIVNLGYVVNVIENAAERKSALTDAWMLAKKMLIVSARLSDEADTRVELPYADGYLTRRGTFQKLFDQSELRNWIDSVLGESSVPAAPGVFYVFRNADLKYRYESARVRRVRGVPKLTRSHAVFEDNRELFEELIAFFTTRGRLPVAEELACGNELCAKVGSIRRAFSILRLLTGANHWQEVQAERAQDLLVYLALARFSKRPRFGVLPASLQLDLRAFFTSYKRACELADTLLFSAGNRSVIENGCRSSQVGKLTPTSLYVHESALAELEPVLRVYEACAHTIVGRVEGANIIKLHFDGPVLSYLSYPDFDTDGHPALTQSVLVDLQTFRVKFRSYSGVANPPILHRKEQFVSASHQLKPRFARLTQSEARKGLFEHPAEIGTRNGWLRALAERNLCVRGHRLLRARSV